MKRRGHKTVWPLWNRRSNEHRDSGTGRLPVRELAVQCLDQGLDGQQSAELTALLVEHLVLDVKPLADLKQHPDDLGRLAFNQQVDLKIQVRAPVRKLARGKSGGFCCQVPPDPA